MSQSQSSEGAESGIWSWSDPQRTLAYTFALSVSC